MAVEVANADSHAGAAVGVDVGVTRLATLSTGEVLANPRIGKQRSAAIAAAQRALARARRRSKRRHRLKGRLAGLQRHEANARMTYLHQQSAALASRVGTIVVEDLNVRK